jgi:hypothetical protein
MKRDKVMKKRFVDNGDGTVTDKETGLMWVKDGKSEGCNQSEPLAWKQAIKFCEKLKFAGYDDWRLPSIKELQSIVDYETCKPSIDNIFSNTQKSLYWSSTEHTVYTSLAWGAYFSYGSVGFGSKKVALYVRPVRKAMKTSQV